MSTQLERAFAVHTSPALCGIKASNLINLDTSKICNAEKEIEELNKKYNPRIYFNILKKNDNNILVLVYKREVLEKYLYEINNLLFLNKLGYYGDLDLMLDRLKEKLEKDSFPHEIGVFLGYDLNDTIAFLEGNKECLYVGYWKVYSNLDAKKKIFNKYKRCINCVESLVSKGFSIENFMK